jgi:DHA1 family bicyclomycin/chloramphenicol resistance-like MFS transporter
MADRGRIAAVEPEGARMGRVEFVAFVAVGFALGALGIDLMLPALHAIHDEFGLQRANLSQAVIAAFMLGVGLPQLLFGLLSDRYGRRSVFFGGVLAFVAGSILSVAAPSFSLLLVARAVQGFGAGAMRVVTFSIVRDRYSGANMARVMSLAMSILLLEPIVAPMIGQALLIVGSWRWIVAATAIAGGAALVWAFLRLDESLPVARRRSISPRAVLAAYRMVFATPAAFGGMVAFGLVMGAHMGFLASAQGIFQVTFDAGLRFTLFLAMVGLATAAAAFLNAFLVRRFASAALVRAALLALLAVNAVALAMATAGALTLPLFLVLQSCSMFAFGLLMPNLTAMIISPLGSIAGTASSLFGFVSTVIAALLGFAIGQLFDGTIRPVACAYILVSACAFVILARYGGKGDEDQGLVVASPSMSPSP